MGWGRGLGREGGLITKSDCQGVGGGGLLVGGLIEKAGDLTELL